jgi:ATP-dependent DNA helicase RecG
MSNPNISIEELAVICGLTRDGINYNIRNLKKQGILRRVGPDKGGHWEVLTPETKD